LRLADFISANVEAILVEWESFARSIWPPGINADPTELRDSAEQILTAIVADMRSVQTDAEQAKKSMGHSVTSAHSDRLDNASEVHGAGRVGSGLALPAVVAEYRALRASVLRLWQASDPRPHLLDLTDLIRFNEAIDQSLDLAVSSFTRRVDTARKLFLGILGHDLRNPLTAITVTTRVAMMSPPDSAGLKEQLAQILASATSVSDLVTDLVDFASSTMGVGLPLAPARTDLHLVCVDAARECRAVHPDRSVRLSVRGDLNGTWDSHRLRQAIVNLLANAHQHGAPMSPVDLSADGTDPEAVLISVFNKGEPIPPAVLPTIFDPLVRGPTSVQQRRTPGSIGLGLYIVREIATAHGGSAELTSDAGGTTATIRLPRHAVRR
jgi:hypothetical protein